MDLEKQLKAIEAIGDDHIGASLETPLRVDAFELSDIEKIALIQKDVRSILDAGCDGIFVLVPSEELRGFLEGGGLFEDLSPGEFAGVVD